MFLYISIYVLSIVIVAKGKNISIYVYVVHIYMTRYSVSNHWQAAVVWEILPPQHVLDISLAIDWSYSTRCTSPMLSENRRAKKTTTTNGWRRETQTEVIYICIYIYIHIIIQKNIVMMLVTHANQSILQWIPGQIPADSQWHPNISTDMHWRA